MAGSRQSADREIEACKLLFREHHEERFQQYVGLPQAGIQIEMACFQGLPESRRNLCDPGNQLRDYFDEFVAEVVDEHFKSIQFVQELRALREKNLADQVAMPGGTLPAITFEISRFQQRQIGYYAKMPGVLPHRVKNRIDAKRQSRAEFPDDANFQVRSSRIAAVVQRNGLVQRHAENHVAIFQLVDMVGEKRTLGLGQDGTPVLLDRVIPAGRGAGIQMVLSQDGRV